MSFDLYHLSLDRDRYYLNVSQQFVEGVNTNVQLDPGYEFRISDSNGVVQKILYHNNGITEVEYPVSEFTYEIHLELEDISHVGLTGEWMATSSSNPITPTSVIITADTVLPNTYLAVSSSTITDNSTNVDPRAEWELTFDDNLERATVTRQGMLLLEVDSMKTIGASIVIVSDTVVRIRPDASLKENTSYRFILMDETDDNPWTSTSGFALSDHYILNFTTGVDSYKQVSEITEPGRIERTAPLRIATDFAGLTPVESPTFANGLSSWCVSDQAATNIIEIQFNKDLDTPLDTTGITVTVAPALGDPSFYADANGVVYYPNEPDTIPVVSDIRIGGFDNRLEIEFDTDLFNNTVVTVEFTATPFADETTFTGQYKYMTTLYPQSSTPTILRMEMRGFLSDVFTDCDILLYDHKTTMENLIYYGTTVSGSSRCGKVFKNFCKWETVANLLQDWLAENAVIGESKTLGDFKISRIPRPEIILMSTSKLQDKANEWKKRLHKCLGNMRWVDHKVNNSAYPHKLRIRLWALDWNRVGANTPVDRYEKYGDDIPSNIDPRHYE